MNTDALLFLAASCLKEIQNSHSFFFMCKKWYSVCKHAPNCTKIIVARTVSNICVEKNVFKYIYIYISMSVYSNRIFDLFSLKWLTDRNWKFTSKWHVVYSVVLTIKEINEMLVKCLCVSLSTQIYLLFKWNYHYGKENIHY